MCIAFLRLLSPLNTYNQPVFVSEHSQDINDLICIKIKAHFNLKEKNIREIKCLTNGLIKSAICVAADSRSGHEALVWSGSRCVAAHCVDSLMKVVFLCT